MKKPKQESVCIRCFKPYQRIKEGQKVCAVCAVKTLDNLLRESSACDNATDMRIDQ